MAKPSVPEVSAPKPRQRGEGRVYLRDRLWWIRYWHRGQEHRESSYSTDPAVADKLLDRRLKEIWAERQGHAVFNPSAEKIRVDELLDALEKDYRLRRRRGMRQFKTHLKPIRETFGDMRAVQVIPRHVDNYIDRQQEGGLAPATINRQTQLLGQAFRLGIERGEILTAPHIRKLEEGNVRQGFFEPAEFEVVVAALPEDLRDYTRFAYLCAWRKGQIDSLEWPDVDRGAGTLQARAEHVKNGRAHKIVLEGELAEIIERRWAARVYQTPNGPGISKYVFHRKGRPIRDPRRAWASACKAAGLVKPKLDRDGEPIIRVVDGKEEIVMVHARTFHDLRRSGVRNMMRAGVKETVAMAISGHRTRAVFDRYNITSDEDLRQAVKQTQEHLKAKSAVQRQKLLSFERKQQ